jgi:hypothetical protein
MNKRLLLLSISALSAAGLFAQSVPNGGFENWNANSFEDLTYYQTSNFQNIMRGLPVNVEKVADPQQGSWAIKLTTVNMGPDTSFGFIINGDPNTMAGGIAYNQHPVTLTGYYKSDIAPGDTGFILVVFKQGGMPLSIDLATFTGTHTSYTPFTVTLTIPTLSTPDTVLIGAASSNAFSSNGIPGSMLQLDNLSFTGVASQPAQLNGSFENWTQRTRYLPLDWDIGGDDTLSRSGNAHSGNYCLKLTTIGYGGSDMSPGVATTGQLTNQGITGGRPYATQMDTLTGWYKYIPVGIDSATLWLQTSNNHTPVGGAFVGLAPAASWTYFSVPISSMMTPDTLMVTFASVYNNFDSTNVGSVLYVDDVYLKSSPASTGTSWNLFGPVTISPNPSTDFAWLDFTSMNEHAITVSVFDATGKLVSAETINGTGAQRYRIETVSWPQGVYSLVIEQDGARVVRPLVKQ